jgi:hypothetical protein
MIWNKAVTWLISSSALSNCMKSSVTFQIMFSSFKFWIDFEMCLLLDPLRLKRVLNEVIKNQTVLDIYQRQVPHNVSNAFWKESLSHSFRAKHNTESDWCKHWDNFKGEKDSLNDMLMRFNRSTPMRWDEPNSVFVPRRTHLTVILPWIFI